MQLKKTPQEIFEESGIEFKPTKASLMIGCHVCGTDKKKRAVRRTNGGNKCFKCGNSMSFMRLLSELLGISYEQVLVKYGTSTYAAEKVENKFSDLVDSIKVTMGFKEKPQRQEEEGVLKPVILDTFFKPIETSVQGVEYLVKRGVASPKVWIDYDIRFHPIMGGPVFPVKMFGKIVGWQCRKINPGSGPRMLSMEGPWKSLSLLNYDNARKVDEIGLFEGPFDALAAEMSSLVSVATLGKIISKKQMQLLKDLPARRIYLGFDRDAYKEVRDFCKEMCKHKEVYRLVVPSHRDDFGECTPEEIRQAKESAEQCFSSDAGRVEIFLKF
jgi:hypothetical protein